LAHSPRGWTGARTPSAIKRVRQSERRRAINQPRRSAAKTLISKALTATTTDASPEEVQEAVRRAVSALDRAAKSGAIHRNAAARRKSRLVLKVNATLEGAELVATGKAARSTGKAAATKQAKARIAASKASKAKGAQTAAGKARVALARSTREPATPAPEAPAATEAPAAKTSSRSRTGATSRKAAAPKADAEAKPRAKRSTKKS
jgi:small subunit ribosomal protein S20